MEQCPVLRRRHLSHVGALAGQRRRRRRDRHPVGRPRQPHRRARQPAVPRGTGHAAGRRRGSHQHRHDHPDPHPQQREVGDRDLDPARLLRRRPRPGQDEDQRRLRPDPGGQARQPGPGRRRRRGRGRPGHRGRPRGAHQDRRRPDRRHRRPLRRDRPARLLADHRGPRRRRRLPQRAGVRTPFGRRLPGGPATAQRPRSPQLRAPAPRTAARRPGPGGAPAGGDGLAGPPGHLRQDAVQPYHGAAPGSRRAAFGGDLGRVGRDGFRAADAEAGRRQRRVRHHPGARRRRLERRRHAERGAGGPAPGGRLGEWAPARAGGGQDRGDRLHAREDHRQRRQRHRHQRPGRGRVRRVERQGFCHGHGRQQRRRARQGQPGPRRQERRHGGQGGLQGIGWAAGDRRRLAGAGSGAGGAGQRLQRPGLGPVGHRDDHARAGVHRRRGGHQPQRPPRRRRS